MTEYSTNEIAGIIELLELETSEGTLRFVVGDDGQFTDMSGNIWTGSKLISLSEIDQSINGTAPTLEASFAFIQDPDEPDLIEQIKRLGGAATIKGRTAKVYEQLLTRHEEFFAPASSPELITQRRMENLTFTIDGPQQRTLSVTMEGPFALRSKPSFGVYNTADHATLIGVSENPSLEFMPKDAIDEQAFFGL